ncbi:heavy metal translocating P-type ATPase [Citroniella saccharovorans]|uniref:Cd(2+)-exporting ATPase n=1 Tax=Citroniella saccharovorans TaxID=2053367 RepID=A0AAW9N014_9FIRM|nr:heavy metal translocating P-type ATPase [Citroniella saccharovorans]MEB3430200.1 heavy metal translocating P-type ATPase [Citroniella saccharovorans]
MKRYLYRLNNFKKDDEEDIKEKLKGLEGVLDLDLLGEEGFLSINAKDDFNPKSPSSLFKKFYPSMDVISLGKSYQYDINNLGCANCAMKIERLINKSFDFLIVKVDFSRKKLIINSNRDLEEKDMRKINDCFKEIEAYSSVDFGIKDEDEDEDEEKEESNLAKSAYLIISILLFALSFIIKNKLMLYSTIAISYLLVSHKVIINAINNLKKGRVFDENFLILIASLGAFAIGEYKEALTVMILYAIGEFLEDLATEKSRKEIEGLMDLREEYANLISDGEIRKVESKNLNIGDKILVRPGERVPVDGKIINGNSSFDTKMITGESVPKNLSEGDMVYSATINLNSPVTLEVDSLFEDSMASKILDIIENSSSKSSPEEKFITKFSRVYTPTVVILALAMAFLMPLVTDIPFKDWVYRSLVFLVASCPCALVISIPLGFFAGIGKSSSEGILVKGSGVLERASKANHLVFDKTGTLTKGNFKVTEVISKGESREEILKLAAMAEQNSNHPISKSIKAEVRDFTFREDVQSEDFRGEGLVSIVNGDKIYVGNEKLMNRFSIDFEEVNTIATKAYVAKNEKYLGCIIIEDEIKEEVRSFIKNSESLGIKETSILSGDNKEITKEVANKLAIKNAYGELFPEDKRRIVEDLKKDYSVLFVGDGLNDAPVMLEADVSLSMGYKGEDGAVEASDAVIMNDDISLIGKFLKISKKTLRVVRQNIIFALLFKLIVLVLGFFGKADMAIAIFADTGVALLAILNAVRILFTKF